jgi:hypothetical protein
VFSIVRRDKDNLCFGAGLVNVVLSALNSVALLDFHFLCGLVEVGLGLERGGLGVNSCLNADYNAIRGHAVAAEYTLCSAIGDAPGADDVTGGLLAGDGIGDCESV